MVFYLNSFYHILTKFLDAEDGEIVDMSLESAPAEQKVSRPSKEENLASAKKVIINKPSSTVVNIAPQQVQ
jgi:hypothetical protein